jgi:hypothetical protein
VEIIGGSFIIDVLSDHVIKLQDRSGGHYRRLLTAARGKKEGSNSQKLTVVSEGSAANLAQNKFNNRPHFNKAQGTHDAHIKNISSYGTMFNHKGQSIFWHHVAYYYILLYQVVTK